MSGRDLKMSSGFSLKRVSVAKEGGEDRLALRELEASSCAALAVFLSFFGPGVAG